MTTLYDTPQAKRSTRMSIRNSLTKYFFDQIVIVLVKETILILLRVRGLSNSDTGYGNTPIWMTTMRQFK